MKRLTFQKEWPESWQYSYQYDLMEIYSDLHNLGYAYAYANRRQHTLDLIEKVARPRAKILDVAAGQGNFTLSLAELGYEMTWNDLREELVDYVKLKWEYGQISYAPGDVFQLDYEEHFDVILVAEVIEHVAHPDKFLKTIAKMLKPGGYVVMSTPNGGYIRNGLPKFSDFIDTSKFEKMEFQPDADGHIFLLHLDEVEFLAAQADLVVEEVRLFNNPLTNGYLKLITLLELMPRSWVDACEKLTCHLPKRLQCQLHTGMVALLASRCDKIK